MCKVEFANIPVVLMLSPILHIRTLKMLASFLQGTGQMGGWVALRALIAYAKTHASDGLVMLLSTLCKVLSFN